MLSIVETNAFKQLTHLELGLRAAHDGGVKKYLAARLALAGAALARTADELTAKRREADCLGEALKRMGALRRAPRWRGGAARFPAAQ